MHPTVDSLLLLARESRSDWHYSLVHGGRYCVPDQRYDMLFELTTLLDIAERLNVSQAVKITVKAYITNLYNVNP